MLFKKHKLYLSGGIGNQILHLLIQIDDVIKKKIEPSDLEIIICKYKKSLKEKQYHNIEEIKDYLVFLICFFKITGYNQLIKEDSNVSNT